MREKKKKKQGHFNEEEKVEMGLRQEIIGPLLFLFFFFLVGWLGM